MAQRNVERLAASKEELREFSLPLFPRLSETIVAGNPIERAAKVRQFNAEMERWRNETQALFQQWLLVIKQTK